MFDARNSDKTKFYIPVRSVNIFRHSVQVQMANKFSLDNTNLSLLSSQQFLFQDATAFASVDCCSLDQLTLYDVNCSRIPSDCLTVSRVHVVARSGQNEFLASFRDLDKDASTE